MGEYKYGNNFNGVLNLGHYIPDKKKKEMEQERAGSVPDVMSSLSYSNFTNGSICENNELGSLTLNYRVAIGNMDNVHTTDTLYLNVAKKSDNNLKLDKVWLD